MGFHKYINVIFFACLFSCTLTYAKAADILGTWVTDVDGNHIEMTFTVDGTALTGRVDNSESGSAEIKEGTVDGTKISFNVIRKMPGFGDSEFKTSWTGEIIGDEILFKREFAGNTKGVIARRRPATSDGQAKQEDIQSDAGALDHLTGKWILNDMKRDIVDLRVNGSSLSGTVDVNNMGSVEIKEGKIEGGKLYFHVVRQLGANKVDASWEGTVVENEIHFDVAVAGNRIVFIARKEETKTEPDTKQQVSQDNTAAYDHLSGKWAGSTEQGEMILDLKIEGTSLTGTTGVKEMPPAGIIDGKIEGDRITFRVMRRMMGRQLMAEWEGKIVGDEIQFTIHRAAGSTAYFVVRKVEVDGEGNEKKEIILPPTIDPSGTWIMQTDDQRITMIFRAVGMSLTGTIMDSRLGTTSIKDGRISGDTVSFYLVKRIGPKLFRIPWKGKVIGKEIHFQGGVVNKISDVIAKKVKSSGKGQEKETIKLVRDEEIKNSKVDKKYKKLRKKDSEYDAAMEFFDRYQYRLALPLLEQIYKRLPKDAVLLHHLGVCLIMQSVYPSESHERKDMRARARSLLEKSKKLGMENALLEYYLTVVPESGGWDDSFSKGEKAKETMKEAEKAYALRDYQNCIGLYAKAMEMDPTNYKAVLYIGDSYFANGQYKDAGEWFDRATKVDPDKETAWRYWGDCLSRQDKKEAGRSKYIDALIAEPYNQMSWNGIRNLINSNRVKFAPPDIQRPQRLEATGELMVAEKNDGNSDDNESKSSPDGTEAWSYYNKVAREWHSKKFNAKFPDEKEYRHTLSEEKEALELVAETVNEDIKKGRVDSNNLNPGIKTLLELQASGLLEPYILFHLADRGIVRDYPSYREKNRDKLKAYLDRFEVPKAGDQRAL